MPKNHFNKRYNNQNPWYTDDELEPDPCENEPEKENQESETRGIEEVSSVVIRHGGRIIYCLTIVGQIEGHYILSPRNKTTKYEHIIPLLVTVEEDERIDGLLILLNTVGGDVEAGLAIAEVISGMKKPSVSIVLGGGHSIGIPLAVAAKRSYIAPSASMTVHPVRTTGLTLGVPQAFDYFRRMQDRITGFVVGHSSVTPERYGELVLNTGELVTDVGTILEGADAVNEGLIDRVGTLSEAIEGLCELIDSTSEPEEEEKQQEENR